MKFSKIQSPVKHSPAASKTTAPVSKSKFVPVLLATGMFLAVNATSPIQAQAVTYDVTTTWYEPMTQPDNSVFVGSFNYDASTHAVTGLQGELSEAMTDQGSGETWLSLNNQLPNGDASHTYEWYDAALSGTFATVFLQNTSLTFSTDGGTLDGWSPQAGIAAGWKYPNPNTAPNAYALIFVPDNLSAANPVSLVWDESTDTGSLGLASTAYADNTPGGYMGSIGMTGTSGYIYGNKGTMQGVPLSEIISAVPEPSSLVLISAGGLALLAIPRRKLRA